MLPTSGHLHFVTSDFAFGTITQALGFFFPYPLNTQLKFDAGFSPQAAATSLWQIQHLHLQPFFSLHTIYTCKLPFCPKLSVVTFLSGSSQRSLNQRCLLKDKGKKYCSATKSTVRRKILKRRKYKIFCSINYSIWPNFHALNTRLSQCFGRGRSWQQKKKSWHKTCTCKSLFEPKLMKSPF